MFLINSEGKFFLQKYSKVKAFLRSLCYIGENKIKACYNNYLGFKIWVRIPIPLRYDMERLSNHQNKVRIFISSMFIFICWKLIAKELWLILGCLSLISSIHYYVCCQPCWINDQSLLSWPNFVTPLFLSQIKICLKWFAILFITWILNSMSFSSWDERF